jgi:hypothetical protein
MMQDNKTCAPGEQCVTPNCLLVPVGLMAAALVLFFGFQSSQIIRERAMLQETKAQQQPTLEQGQKVQQQLEALSFGTLKLADEGNKNAKAIIARMKELGITVNPPKADAAKAGDAKAPASTAPAPAPEAPKAP